MCLVCTSKVTKFCCVYLGCCNLFKIYFLLYIEVKTSLCISGLDYGGLTREWIHILIDELFHKDGALFRRFNKDDPQALVCSKEFFYFYGVSKFSHLFITADC